VSDELVSEKLMPEEAVPSGVYFVKPPAELILALDEAVGRL
jgi:hypothetical protein